MGGLAQYAQREGETDGKERALCGYAGQQVVDVKCVVDGVLALEAVGEAEAVGGEPEPLAAHHAVDDGVDVVSALIFRRSWTVILTVGHGIRIVIKKPALGVSYNHIGCNQWVVSIPPP